jgi:hypothetical protein
MELLKYNMGCGPKYLDGYVNVDGFAWDKVDYIHDLTDIPYVFAENESASEIVAIEVLEHISFKDTRKVLQEWYRILAKGGELHIQVPDCGKMMEYYINEQVCECVPHKDIKEEFKANENCVYCEGKAMVNPKRWLFAFTGAQKHPFDTHKNIFTIEILDQLLSEIGFINIKFKDDKNKLKVKAFKI